MRGLYQQLYNHQDIAKVKQLLRMIELTMYLNTYRVGFLAWSTLIILLLSIPGAFVPGTRIIGVDKIVHAAMFALWFYLGVKSMVVANNHKVIALIVGGVIFAFASELYQQTFILNRQADVFDVAADIVGLIIGYLISRSYIDTQ
jgi:hypothetical protein